MTRFEDLKRQFVKAWPTDRRGAFDQMVAVSGGADSVALLRLLVADPGPGRVFVAHFDHRLRPESADDCRFVESLAHEFQLEFRSRAARDSLPRADEAAARAARYQFLREEAERVGARYVLTAHTADDQAETILHRILRGTGPRGLRGMRPLRSLSPAVTLVRPLLAVRRSALVEYLRSVGQSFRTDPSNWDQQYTRNRMRQELFPLLEQQYNVRVVEALLRVGQLTGAMYDEWQAGLEEPYNRHVCLDGPRQITVDRQNLDTLSLLAVTELLARAWRQLDWPEQAMGLPDWQRLAQMATAGHPRQLALPAGMAAEVVETRLIIRRLQTA